MSKKLFFSLLTIFIIISLFLILWILPIYIASTKVLDLYTTISKPEDFNYGINIDSNRPYSVQICWSANLFSHFRDPRFVVISNSYLIDGGYDTEVHIIKFSRNELPLLNPKPETLAAFTSDKNYEETVNIFNKWCNINFSDSSIVTRSYQELLQLKSDAKKTPQELIPNYDERLKELQERYNNSSQSSNSLITPR